MSTKTAYVWGPIYNFSASLLALMLENGWQVHLACKSALQFSLSPLDLSSSAQHNIEKAVGNSERFKALSDRLSFLENEEPQKGTTYDVIIFMGLPSNFDEPRVSRAPWAADELLKISSKLKGVPVVVISSLSAAIQPDGVVPEEIEFERRKAKSHYEGVCQQYETKILKAIEKSEAKWHLVRLPLLLGSSKDGRSLKFNGLYNLLQELYLSRLQMGEDCHDKSIDLHYNTDSTVWMLPLDVASNLVYNFIDDPNCPVICNVVSTQSMLIQEWMQELAAALGVKSINASEKDSLNINNTLRALLTDNIQVKTRNLFELLGRFQQQPVSISKDYFAKVIDYACKNNWGQSKASLQEELFSSQKARRYFCEFLPEKLDKKSLKTLASFSGGLAFQIPGEDNCSFLLEAQDGKANVKEFEPDKHKPQAVFQIAAASFLKLCSGKLLFEQSLLTRSLQVSGSPLTSLKACDFFRRVLRKHHFENGSKSEVENNGQKVQEEAEDPSHAHSR